jgi:predicted thioesterase
MFAQIQPGLVGEIETIVAPEHTALHLGSGQVAVLATPHMIRLMETAAVRAVDPLLPDGYGTVGVHVDVSHQAATPVGLRLRVTARLSCVDGRKLTFEVTAADEREVVGHGRHQRMIVEVSRFKQRTELKLAASQPGKDPS